MESPAPERLRLAELVAALSLATDLGMGQPMAHALRTCLVGLALGRQLRLPDTDLADAYYTTLLRYVGCTSDSHDFVAFAGGDDVGFRRAVADVANGTADEVVARLVAFMTGAGVTGDVAAEVRAALESRRGLAASSMTAHCEVASMLAARLGLRPAVCHALRHGFERWDGHGFPQGQTGDEVPFAVRLALVARDIEVLTRSAGRERAAAVLQQRRGRAHDPRIVDAFLRSGDRVLNVLEQPDPWSAVLASQPGGPLWITGVRIDDALTAFADFADVKTPFTLGHSRGVAVLAERAAHELGLSRDEVTCVRRAALLHDLGRTGIANAIWERRGPLSFDQWERVRLHTYYTERILSCCEMFQPLGALAAAHHERLDGSGYHRGSRARDLTCAARLLAAADACQAMMQARPHRPARTPDEAACELGAEVSAGRLDACAVDAVLAAAGVRPRPAALSWPGGLTDREVEVIRLMARGLSNREIAATLHITTKTAGHHVQHIYDKLGFSTRAAAAIFVLEHGL